MSPLKLAYDASGPTDGTPLVLLHGLSSNRAVYGRVAEALASKPYRVLAVDLRGHGTSPHAAELGDYSAPEYASDVAALIEAQFPGKKAIVAGHSLGGVVAAHLAESRPDIVSAVFLEDPPLYEGDEARRKASPAASLFPKLVAGVKNLRSQNGPVEAYDRFSPPGISAEEVKARSTGLLTWDPRTMEAALAGVIWRGYTPTSVLACPVTVLAADPKVGAVFAPEDVAAFGTTNKHAKMFTITGASHSINGTPTAAEYLKHLVEFLDGLEGAKSKL
ncbi:Alpha/Beta hydrolase protein [Hyaloraphidium curvatum]|nr:Alpha/Beta hydrolase protein [Hyaloraphidium curvatum]